MENDRLNQVIGKLALLWDDVQERSLLEKTIKALDVQYGLSAKIKEEPGVEEIITQMIGRLAHAFGKLSQLRGLKILDIACGSNSSKAPAMVQVNTPFGKMTLDPPPKGFTALFEPWFCRMLFELGADPVGVDLGNLDCEKFTHVQVDLGKLGALDILPDQSFDAIQDSRLFGSPEFTAQFPGYKDRLQVAQEIRRQEVRLLTPGGIIIHSDARELAGS
jgi:hypothetical protein